MITKSLSAYYLEAEQSAAHHHQELTNTPTFELKHNEPGARKPTQVGSLEELMSSKMPPKKRKHEIVEESPRHRMRQKFAENPISKDHYSHNIGGSEWQQHGQMPISQQVIPLNERHQQTQYEVHEGIPQHENPQYMVQLHQPEQQQQFGQQLQFAAQNVETYPILVTFPVYVAHFDFFYEFLSSAQFIFG